MVLVGNFLSRCKLLPVLVIIGFSLASCLSSRHSDFAQKKYLDLKISQSGDLARRDLTESNFESPKDSVKTLVYDCPGDTIRLASGKELVADVVGIGFNQIHFRKKKPDANVQHLKLKYIDTVRWDGYVQNHHKAIAIDTSVLAERDVIQKRTTGKKQILIGTIFSLVPSYSLGGAALSTFMLTGVVTIPLFYWLFLALVPVGVVLLIIGLSRWSKARKAL